MKDQKFDSVRGTVDEEFTLDCMVLSTLSVYEKLLKEKNSGAR